MNDIFLRACARQPVPRTPVWYMRQAGRYQKEYRAIRERHGILEICRSPELTAEVTRLPVERLGVDAAILFSDIMVPLVALGADVRIEEGVGPVVGEPPDPSRLGPLEPDRDVGYVLEAVSMLVRELDVPLIGFAGAPFTMASYLIEGGPSRSFVRTKQVMLEDPGRWDELMGWLTQVALASLRAQVLAGAHAVQLFDSWAGALGPDDYALHVLQYSRRIFEGLADLGVPRIHFGVGTGGLLELMRDAGADVIGLDWRVPLDAAWDRLGAGVAVQGNLDPAALLGPWEGVEEKTLRILTQAEGRMGHVFNLGHGVLPETDPDALRRLTDLVHERTGVGEEAPT